MIKVIWKDIEGYEGIYQINNFGEVMRKKSLDSRGHLRKARLLKQSVSVDGYLQLGLHKNGKETKHLVHRLVANAFLDNPNCLPEINHKDENKKNNFVSNLEWCDRKYNSNYGTLQERRLNQFKTTMLMKKEERNYA